MKEEILTKAEYVYEDGQQPKWKLPDGTLVEYEHQDGNFSNLCTFKWCMCHQ